MDLLEDFLAQPHARDAFLLRVVMGRPWSLLVEDEAPLSIIPVLSGGAWIAADGSLPRRFEAGEVLVVRSPTTYTLSSDRDPGGGARIGAGQVCSGPDGRDLSEEMSAGVRTWGNDPQGEDQLLVGTYRHHSELGRLMLQSLPPWFLVSAPDPELVRLLNRETAHDGFAQSSVLDRLLDVLLVTTLRAWVDAAGTQNHVSLLSASRDNVVRRATEAVQADPSREWTVESLAALAGASRASLTRRFKTTLGVSPMTYVTQWRLATAADLLDRSDATLSAIAHQVGYASPFSFSSAFKSRYGLSPRDFRAATAASRTR
ncbi:AraC family transcriptional regulator [Actinomyces viscosus]|uniref:AraC family transcriptional regulator n=1 Tax=Actinomyces viscosus TaxID=1656 RepID=UPI0028F1460B|nr:AraC family transcriptional regulator [Actinomyces viscosus]